MILLLALPLLIVMNVAAFVSFAIDKRRAERGEWRIAEATLLQLAFFGGSIGACWGRARFRHKTRKQPFAMRLDLIAMLHAGLALGLVLTFLL
jgi:uncharacterized membrane protein YsdA (DUF1294 family)